MITSTSFQARHELTKAWGFAFPWNALAAFADAKESGAPVPVTPALTFSTREGYLAARAAWRARQKAMEVQIRALKAARRGDTEDSHSSASMEARAWAKLAHAALIERAFQKAEASRQWAAARAKESVVA